MLSRSVTMPTHPQNHSLSIIMNKPFYFTDEYLDGKVELSTSAQIILTDIYLSFTLSENWTSRKQDKNIAETFSENLISIYLDIKRILNINTNLISLSPGKFSFPFYFKLPKKVSPCFEFPTGETNCYIRYTISAQIVSPYIKGSSSSYILLKARPDLSQKQISFNTSCNLHKWGLIKSGTTCLSVIIPKGTNVKNGEIIPLDIEVDNTKGKLNAKECKFTLKRIINLKSKLGKNIKEEIYDCISRTINTLTSINEKKKFQFSLDLKEMNNSIFSKGAKLPYINVTDMTYFLPSINSKILECKYILKITLYFDTFVIHGDRPRIEIPINLCHQTIEEYTNKTQGYQQTQNTSNNQYTNNQYNSNQYNNKYNNTNNNVYNNNVYNNNSNNNVHNNNVYNNNVYNNNSNNNVYNNNVYNNNSNNNVYNNNVYNNQNNQNNNIYNRSNTQIPTQNKSNISLMNNENNCPVPPSFDNNKNNEETDIDLPSQDEIENKKNEETNETNDLGAPSFEAPAPPYSQNPNYNDIEI